MVSGWTVFFALLAAYILVAAFLARREDEDGSFKMAGPFLLWRTTRGRDLIDRIAGPKRFWRAWGDLAIVATVAAGLLTLALLVFQLVLVVTQPETVSQSAPEPVLLLGIPGVNPLIPIWYGIFALLLALVVHEGSHGILARAADLEVKSLGLLVFILPIGAFVEPDEEDLRSASSRDRNRVYSAGPMSNLVVGGIAAVVFSGVFIAGLSTVGGGTGVGIAGVVPDSPADGTAIQAGSVIETIDGRPIDDLRAFGEALTAPQPVEGARGQAYDLDGHQDALRTPGNRTYDASLLRSFAAGMWVEPDGRNASPVLTLGPAGDGARPDCAAVRLSLVPGADGPVVRLDRGASRLEAAFPEADWPTNWTRVGVDATGGGVSVLLGDTWKGVREAGSNPHACQETPSQLQAWVGAGPGGFLDGAVDETRLLRNASKPALVSVLDRPYQGEDGGTRNASQPVRRLGGEVLLLQMDEDDVNEPRVDLTRDRSGTDRHGRLVGPRAGDEITVTVRRDGETETVTVTLADKGEYYAREAPESNRPSFEGAGFLGVSAVPMDRVETFRDVLASPWDDGPGGVLLYISYPFLVFTQNLDLLNAPLNAFFVVGGPAAGLGAGFWVGANTLYWVFWINLMLGTFNALPAGPLDGGHMFRTTLEDVLWRVYGVDEDQLTVESGDDGVRVRGRDPETQRKLDRVDVAVSRATWTLGLAILALILVPVVGPRLVAVIP